LKQNKTLKELYLSFNRINNTGMSQLSEFLTANSSLEILDLSKNAFSDNGFVDFGRQLGHNKGL
jgi:Ran GTPase-activating protein (RanGAP) involved in mRNA processing and transport